MATDGEFAHLYATISGRTDQLESALDSMRGRLGVFGGILQGIGQQIVSSFMGLAARGIGAITGAISTSIKASSDMTETLQKVGVVFGQSSGIVTGAAQDMADRFGVPRREFIDAASSIGLIGKAAGLSQQDAANMAQQMAKLAVDTSSFYNIPVDEALRKIQAGLVGQVRPLRELGVLLDEGATQAEIARLGLSRFGGMSEQQQKVIARASLIQRGLADANGDLARTFGSPANQMRALSGRAMNLAADLGTALMPAFRSVLSVGGDALARFGGWLQRNQAAVTAWAEQIGGWLGQAQAYFWRGVDGISAALSTLTSNPMVQQWVGLIGGAIERVRGIFAQVPGFLAPLFGAMGNALGAEGGIWANIFGGMDWQTLAAPIGAALTLIRDTIAGFYNWVAATGPKIATFLTPIGQAMWEVVQAVSDAVMEFIAAVRDIANMVPGLLQAAGIGPWAQSASDWFGWLRDQVAGFVSGVAFAIRNFGDILAIAGITIVEKLTDIGNMFPWVLQLAQSFAQWFGQNWRTIFLDAFEAVTTALINLGQNFRDFGKSVYDWITSGFQTPFNFQATPLMQGMAPMQTQAFEAPALPQATDLSGLKQPHLDAIAAREAARQQKATAGVAVATGDASGALEALTAGADAATQATAGMTGAQGQQQAEAEQQQGLMPQQPAQKPSFIGLGDFAKKVQEAVGGDPAKQQVDVAYKQLHQNELTNKHLEELNKKGFPGVAT